METIRNEVFFNLLIWIHSTQTFQHLNEELFTWLRNGAPPNQSLDDTFYHDIGDFLPNQIVGNNIVQAYLDVVGRDMTIEAARNHLMPATFNNDSIDMDYLMQHVQNMNWDINAMKENDEKDHLAYIPLYLHSSLTFRTYC